VHDQGVYDALSAAAERRGCANGFFPAYRAP
jgi:hypothetical protein